MKKIEKEQMPFLSEYLAYFNEQHGTFIVRDTLKAIKRACLERPELWALGEEKHLVDYIAQLVPRSHPDDVRECASEFIEMSHALLGLKGEVH